MINTMGIASIFSQHAAFICHCSVKKCQVSENSENCSYNHHFTGPRRLLSTMISFSEKFFPENILEVWLVFLHLYLLSVHLYVSGNKKKKKWFLKVLKVTHCYCKNLGYNSSNLFLCSTQSIT